MLRKSNKTCTKPPFSMYMVHIMVHIVISECDPLPVYNGVPGGYTHWLRKPLRRAFFPPGVDSL